MSAGRRRPRALRGQLILGSLGVIAVTFTGLGLLLAAFFGHYFADGRAASLHAAGVAVARLLAERPAAGALPHRLPVAAGAFPPAGPLAAFAFADRRGRGGRARAIAPPSRAAGPRQPPGAWCRCAGRRAGRQRRAWALCPAGRRLLADLRAL